MIAEGMHKEEHSAESKTINTSLSIEPKLLEDAKTIARLAGFEYSFSAYVRDLIRKDLEWRTTGRNQRLASQV